MYRSVFKPLLDWIIALTAVLVLSPILVLVMLMLAVANRGSIWFVQARPGLREGIFGVIKFKTMTDDTDAKGDLLPDEHRLKGFGKWVRATSLDELPQLFNVLKGDMSLVGPRPLLIEYLPLYNASQRTRHDVRPGITGWAQVNGRNAISWKEKFEFDSWYVNHLSFALDSKILLLTLVNVFRARGITSATSVTMEKFRGNE